MWIQSMAPYVSLIEVLNAPALKDGRDQRTHARELLYFRYRNLGFHLAPSVGQDNHYRNWGVTTDARIAVIAPDFSRKGILEARRARKLTRPKTRICVSSSSRLKCCKATSHRRPHLVQSSILMSKLSMMTSLMPTTGSMCSRTLPAANLRRRPWKALRQPATRICH